MIEQDTIKLLRECDAGIKMGISSIDDVLNTPKAMLCTRNSPTARISTSSFRPSFRNS